jgi:AICARFT/IMPCHase bienzyme
MRSQNVWGCWPSLTVLSSACCAAAGWLYQEADSLQPADIEFTVVSETQPTEQQMADLKFAWTAVKHVKVDYASLPHDPSACLSYLAF